MKNLKEILTENRVSVINNIKWYFKIKNNSELSEVMTAFISFCNKNSDLEKLNSSKKIKTDLKFLVYAFFCKNEKSLRKSREEYAITAKYNRMTEEEKFMEKNFTNTHELQKSISSNSRKRLGI